MRYVNRKSDFRFAEPFPDERKMAGQGINGTISNPADWTISGPEAPTISGFARRYPRALRLADVEEGEDAFDDGGHVVVLVLGEAAAEDDAGLLVG